jgi:elongation factor G
VPVLIELAIEARIRADQEQLVAVLQGLVVREASLGVVTDPETGQTNLGGETESQLELVIERLQRELGMAINVGAPQVAYRETLGRKSEIDYTHKMQSGGSGQFARVLLRFEPGALGSGYSFESKIVGSSVPEEFIPGVEKGLTAARKTGVLAGFPVIDFKATLVDGAYHDRDSSVYAFEIAARVAFREALAQAQCKLLEPIMKVEVTTPLGFENDVISDLNIRRARHHGLETRGNVQVIHVLVPARQHLRLRQQPQGIDPTARGLRHDLRSLCADTGTGRRRAISACGRYARVSFRSSGEKCLDAS